MAGPLVRRLLDRRVKAGKEDPSRRHEREGHPHRSRPAGPLVWLHAASVGESLAILPLIDRLLRQDPRLHALVTTGTVTSATLLARRLPARAFHQYIPVDLPAGVERFVGHWRPDLVLWVESEFWPNLLRAVRRRGIPAALINARLSNRSFQRWRRIPGAARQLLSVFRLALAQTEEEAERLRILGLADTRSVGNLKYSAELLPADADQLASLRSDWADRPCWLLASSHPGEEAIAADTHLALRAEFPGLLTIIVPRHPERGLALAEQLTARGLRLACRSRGEGVTAETDLYLADTLGELGLFFRLAPVSAIGASFIGKGGHNPIEPALLGSAVIYGPSMHNFASIAAELEAAGGALPVSDAESLLAGLRTLLRDPSARTVMARAARDVAEGNRQAVDRVLHALQPLLQSAGIAAAPELP